MCVCMYVHRYIHTYRRENHPQDIIPGIIAFYSFLRDFPAERHRTRPCGPPAAPWLMSTGRPRTKPTPAPAEEPSTLPPAAPAKRPGKVRRPTQKRDSSGHTYIHTQIHSYVSVYVCMYVQNCPVSGSAAGLCRDASRAQPAAGWTAPLRGRGSALSSGGQCSSTRVPPADRRVASCAAPPESPLKMSKKRLFLG